MPLTLERRDAGLSQEGSCLFVGSGNLSARGEVKEAEAPLEESETTISRPIYQNGPMAETIC